MKENGKPEVRFPGFEDFWEQRKLGDLGTTYGGLSGKSKEDFGHGEASFITYLNVFNNPVTNPELVEKVEIDPKQNKVEIGDVFFTTSSETPEEVGMSSVLTEECEETYLNSFCFGFRPTYKFDLSYLAFMLRSGATREKIKILAQGISRYNISKKKVMEIEVPVPELEEQKAIGSFFNMLEETITLHQRKIDNLKELKNGLLQKMFPQKGEKVPQVRFPGFTGDWEQRKLSEMAEFSKGSGYSKADIQDEGTPIILYGRLYTNYQAKISSVDTFADQKPKSVLSKGNEVIVPASGETPEEISRASAVLKDGIILGGDLNIITPDKSIDPVFLATVLSSGRVQKELSSKAQGKAVVHLHNSDIREVTVMFPSLEEQSKINGVFDQLDETITLHQRKVDDLKKLKRGLLQKMFV